MPDLDLAAIRRLRTTALTLLSHQASDVTAFLNQENLTYRRLPEQPSKPRDVKVTSSCSCLMSLALSRQFPIVYKHNWKNSAKRAFQRVYSASWRSSGLGLNNAFSTVLVIRTFGLLAQAGILNTTFAHTNRRNYKPLGKATLADIAEYLSRDINRLKINKYPPTAALVYWFVDGVDRGQIPIGAAQWRSLSRWARDEFNRQRSLVVAQHEARMDPIAMAMAACLCSRLRKIADSAKSSAVNQCLQILPSRIELQHGIHVLFEKQSPSGIWPKYFPLFHYPKAGSNYCFAFEMLEAVLAEFGHEGTDLLAASPILQKLERALDWCVNTRLKYAVAGDTYFGWNSGGELESLNAGRPESWATAVAHMFLWELQHVLAVKTQDAILRRYNADYKGSPGTPDSTPWDRLLDMDIVLQGGGAKTSVKSVLEDEIIQSASTYKPFATTKIQGRRSALLFGPPGTSKTQVTRALAAKLGWPVLLIDPSQFLSDGMEKIYGRATEIFRDLEDLSGVVVLFDEMDALVRSRDGIRIDLTSQFLTTSMLPKLAKLHDQGSLVFLFATNYQEEFDPAIKRPGRFDLLLCMGPPSWKIKLASIGNFLDKDAPAADIMRVRKKLTKITRDLDDLQLTMLDLLTYQEVKPFFESFKIPGKTIARSIGRLRVRGFKKALVDFSKYVTIRAGEDTFKRYQRDQKESRLQ